MKANLTKLTLVTSLSLIAAIVNPGVMATQAKEGSISGNWESVLKVGDQKLRLVLKVNSSKDGVLNAVLDSLDQANANNLQVTRSHFKTTCFTLKCRRCASSTMAR